MTLLSLEELNLDPHGVHLTFKERPIKETKQQSEKKRNTFTHKHIYIYIYLYTGRQRMAIKLKPIMIKMIIIKERERIENYIKN